MTNAIANKPIIHNHHAGQRKPAINKDTFKSQNNFWSKAQNFAEVICSRESTYRSALDLTGWEIPAIIAAATRNFYSVSEAIFQAVIAFGTIFLSPQITRLVAKLIGELTLKPEEKNDVDKYILFQFNDLDDQTSFKKGVERIKKEQVNDKRFLANLYSESEEKVKGFMDSTKELTGFLENINYTDDLKERIKKLKKAIIFVESTIESTIWGCSGLLNRLFRKHVLKLDRFSGTFGYLNKDQGKKIGEDAPFTALQSLGTICAVLSGPIMNAFFLKKIDDKSAVEKSPFWQKIKDQWDMTHGVYPKLGLLFSFVQIPEIISSIFTAQGKYELLEQIEILFSIVPSWWLGHKLTNGLLAKSADKKLTEKHGVSRGILVEPEELKNKLPEPAQIQHIINSTEDNPKLQKEARKEHARVLYSGFALHSLLVLGVRLVMNQITKVLALNEVKEK